MFSTYATIVVDLHFIGSVYSFTHLTNNPLQRNIPLFFITRFPNSPLKAISDIKELLCAYMQDDV